MSSIAAASLQNAADMQKAAECEELIANYKPGTGNAQATQEVASCTAYLSSRDHMDDWAIVLFLMLTVAALGWMLMGGFERKRK